MITWRVEGSRRYKLPSLDFRTTIRGINLRGVDFDSLEPVDPSAAAGKLPLNQAGELTDCVLSGDLPCTIAVDGQRRPAVIAFSLDLRPGTWSGLCRRACNWCAVSPACSQITHPAGTA